MDLTLYKVGASGRINLGQLLEGVELAQAVKNDDGTVTISPVNVIPATGKASTIQNVPIPGVDTTLDDDPPFDPDDQ